MFSKYFFQRDRNLTNYSTLGQGLLLVSVESYLLFLHFKYHISFPLNRRHAVPYILVLFESRNQFLIFILSSITSWNRKLLTTKRPIYFAFLRRTIFNMVPLFDTILLGPLHLLPCLSTALHLIAFMIHSIPLEAHLLDRVYGNQRNANINTSSLCPHFRSL